MRPGEWGWVDPNAENFCAAAADPFKLKPAISAALMTGAT